MQDAIRSTSLRSVSAGPTTSWHRILSTFPPSSDSGNSHPKQYDMVAPGGRAAHHAVQRLPRLNNTGMNPCQ